MNNKKTTCTEETCGRHVQARELIDLAGEVEDAVRECLLELLYGAPMPKQEVCQALGAVGFKLREVGKAVQAVTALVKSK
jgi:hypothetical protein